MATSPSTANNASTGQAGDFSLRSFRTLGDASMAQQSTQAADWGFNGIVTATTTVVKTGAGQLHQIIVLGGTLGAITVYDNTAASGAVIAQTFTPVAMTGSGPQVYTFDVSFGVGLTVVTAAATALTVTYR